MIKTYRFVSHCDIEAYKRMGWVFIQQLHAHHGTHGVLMEKLND